MKVFKAWLKGEMSNDSREKSGLGGLTLHLEDEFRGSPLAASLSRSLQPHPLAPIGPADYPSFGRRDLLVTRHRGEFIKPCPGTLNYNCCGLSIFHFGLGCTIGCRYCILTAYLGTEALVLFGNISEGVEELALTLAKPAGTRPLRYCTGEFTDSLLLDRKSSLAARLISMFSAAPAATLELKTKTDNIYHLLGLDHRGGTVISFSVNAPEVCRKEEGGAARLESRLKAAKAAAEAGYHIGLHFDPLIFHPDWEAAYGETVDMIGDYLHSAEVAWVSLGCFRYLPNLKELMLDKFPETTIYNGEFIRGGDGKMRYPRPLRTKMYQYLAARLRPVLPSEAVIYMCMESPRVWRDVFGHDPQTEGLTAMLDRRVMSLRALA